MPSVTIATRTLYVTTQSAHLSAFVRKALQGMEQLAPVTITKYWMQPVVEVFRGLSVCRNLLVSPSESWCDSSSLPSSNFFYLVPTCAQQKRCSLAQKNPRCHLLCWLHWMNKNSFLRASSSLSAEVSGYLAPL